MNTVDTLLWVVVPYVALAAFVVGHYWRYRYDKFGWTTRSSQLYERRLLRWGSPLFHFGILAALGGHVIGLGIPSSWTSAVGVTEHAYHVVAVGIGAVAGACTLAGLAILIYRRRTVGPVFSATTRNDKFMYIVLTATILFGLSNTMLGNVLGQSSDYRESVSPWFRGIFYLQPHVQLIADSGVRHELGLPCLHACCSRSGPSPGSFTSSAPPSATSPVRTSSTAAAHRRSATGRRHGAGSARGNNAADRPARPAQPTHALERRLRDGARPNEAGRSLTR
jgi:nitrate reductase gamma subunit